MAAILENNKAGRKLFFAGYTYNKKKTSADAVYWVCSEREIGRASCRERV